VRMGGKSAMVVGGIDAPGDMNSSQHKWSVNLDYVGVGSL